MNHPRYHAQQMPDKTAYIMARTGEAVKLEEKQFFRDVGLRHNENIAILMENNIEYLEIVCAAWVAGLFYTAINTYLKTAEIEYIVNDFEAKLFVTSAYMKDVNRELLNRTVTCKNC